MTLSPELLDYLAAWYRWATNGAPDGEPYSRAWGLCDNAPWGMHGPIGCELRAEFGTSYPFGMNDFNARTVNATMHECPKRLAYVRGKLVEGGRL